MGREGSSRRGGSDYTRSWDSESCGTYFLGNEVIQYKRFRSFSTGFYKGGLSPEQGGCSLHSVGRVRQNKESFLNDNKH